MLGYSQLPLGISIAASTRVANELGAGNPKSAQFASLFSTILSLSVATITLSLTYFFRQRILTIFTDNQEFLDTSLSVFPILILLCVGDSLQGNSRQEIVIGDTPAKSHHTHSAIQVLFASSRRRLWHFSRCWAPVVWVSHQHRRLLHHSVATGKSIGVSSRNGRKRALDRPCGRDQPPRVDHGR